MHQMIFAAWRSGLAALRSIFAALIILLFSSARADVSIEVGTEFDDSSSLFSVDGNYFAPPPFDEPQDSDRDQSKESYFSMDSFSAGISTSRSKDETAVDPVLNTNSGRVHLSIGVQKALITAGGSASRTSEIKYESKMGYVSFGYPLTDWFQFEIEGGSGSFTQDFSVTVFSQTFYRTFKLEQKSASLFSKFSFLKSWSLGLRYSKFEYDRSDADIRKAVDSPFLNRQASALVSSFTSLLKSGWEVSLNYMINENFDVELQSTRDTRLYDEELLSSWKLIGSFTTESFYVYRLGIHQVNQDKQTRALLASVTIPL